MNKIKVLVVTYLPWRNDTSIGNSFSNIFTNTDDKYEFAHIYFRSDKPNNEIVRKYFQISESKLIKNFFNRTPAGVSFEINKFDKSAASSFASGHSIIRNLRWSIFLLLRDIISLYGPWKSKKLFDFIDDFKPDMVFGILDHVPVTNKLMVEIADKYKIPLITYAWDDFYNQTQLSFSPFTYIKRLFEKKYIKKCADKSKILYTISKEMQQEYSNCFNKECKLLFKGYDFNIDRHVLSDLNKPIKILYTGNIGDDRWKVLAELAKSIKEINDNTKDTKFSLQIYTLSPITNAINKALNISYSSQIMPSVNGDEVVEILKDADMVVQVEPFSNKRLKARLSFSTKIVDYFYSGKCILALGGSTAALEYLKRNDSAIIVERADKIKDVLNNISRRPIIITEYSQKAWECGKRNHDINKIQQEMHDDFVQLIKTNEGKYKHDYGC